MREYFTTARLSPFLWYIGVTTIIFLATRIILAFVGSLHRPDYESRRQGEWYYAKCGLRKFLIRSLFFIPLVIMLEVVCAPALAVLAFLASRLWYSMLGAQLLLTIFIVVYAETLRRSECWPHFGGQFRRHHPASQNSVWPFYNKEGPYCIAIGYLVAFWSPYATGSSSITLFACLFAFWWFYEISEADLARALSSAHSYTRTLDVDASQHQEDYVRIKAILVIGIVCLIVAIVGVRCFSLFSTTQGAHEAMSNFFNYVDTAWSPPSNGK